MTKISIVGNLMIVLGFLITAAAMFVFVWPLGAGLAALLLVSGLVRFFYNVRETLTKRRTPARANILGQPQFASGQLAGASEATTAG